MRIVVIAETVSGVVTQHSREVIGLALSLGETKVLSIGEAGVESAAAGVAAEAGACDLVLAPSTVVGTEVAARVAALLDCALVWDVISISADRLLGKAVFGGTTSVTVKAETACAVATLRAGIGDAVESDGGEAVAKTTACANIVSRRPIDKGSRPDLIGARIVVSGGRGVGSAEGFEAVAALADALGAALGASRAATDAGWIDHSYQVGQTGKTVAPELYVACGISGAIQHLAGMQTSRVILAINQDEAAPIFSVADLAVVGDVNVVVPALTAQLLR